MSLVESIENYIQSVKQEEYEVKEIDFIPTVNNMSSKKSYKFKGTVLSIELRGSNTDITKEWEDMLQIIHKIAITVIQDIITEHEGNIITVDGNRVVAFWLASKSNINKAVNAALSVNWLLSSKLSELTTNLDKFDFGIGIHEGEIFAFKTQVPGGDFHEEQVNYISPVIDFVNAMSNQLIKPNSLGISEVVYSNLYDESKKIKKSFILIPYEKNIWEDDKINYVRTTYKIKTTKHYRDIEEEAIANV